MTTPSGTNRYPKRKPTHPGRVELIQKEFDNLIEDQGVRVRITPTVLCPNRTSLDDTNHVLKCPVCFGHQTVDIVDGAIEDWAFIQGIKLDKQFQMQGIWDLKDAMISTKSHIRIYYWYKVEILDSASNYNQIIERGTSDRDSLRYIPVVTATDTPYYLVDSAGNFYKKDKHYRIVDQQIEWKTVIRPEEGKLYSFIYPVLPTFRILELLHENRYYFDSFKRADKAPIQMPQQAVMRWDHLARGGSGLNNEGP